MKMEYYHLVTMRPAGLETTGVGACSGMWNGGAQAHGREVKP